MRFLIVSFGGSISLSIQSLAKFVCLSVLTGSVGEAGGVP